MKNCGLDCELHHFEIMNVFRATKTFFWMKKWSAFCEVACKEIKTMWATEIVQIETRTCVINALDKGWMIEKAKHKKFHAKKYYITKKTLKSYRHVCAVPNDIVKIIFLFLNFLAHTKNSKPAIFMLIYPIQIPLK